jgi:hypothetical protein
MGLLAFDFLTFVFTLRKSLKESSIGGSTIMRVLLRDGVCYPCGPALSLIDLIVFAGAIYFGSVAHLTSVECAHAGFSAS